MGLRIYTVHLPTSSLREAITRAVPHLVKEGFSWPAFFLGVIWALWHRLWIEAAALIALFLAIGIILEFIEPGESIETAVVLAIAVLIGNAGNNWRRESLRRRGFLDGGVVAGPDPENALCRYLDLRAAARTEPPAPGSAMRFGAPVAASQFTTALPVEDPQGDREFPDEQPDNASPGRAAPGTGYGG